ncbi:hypothetical protein ONS95_000655 [Cadophora gregata]|uniref:uncharacterized protein n=1 Tax=Cadophora gregata TaxID=51156 RepID=UPI0026DACFF4|nr:uncharacterized protein ONS95_000655 [Cadophora gregata]KAK0125318.1 hypothetical protein ONS96_009171 [Cadophora gregata f. sp. sojae]KAK0128699.1 hypothetical protein ONS95_000655 [Cadophora gregata]
MTRRSAKKNSRLEHSQFLGPRESLRVMIDISDSDDEPAPPLQQSQAPPNYNKPRKQKSKTKKSKQVKQSKTAKTAIVETPEDSEDELGNAQQLVPKHRQKQPPNASREKEVLRGLEKAAKILTSLGAQADVKGILQHVASRNDNSSIQLQDHCATISALLSPSSSTSTLAYSRELPDTIQFYNQYFAHLGPGRRLYVLRPVEVLQGNTNLTRRKVTGFIQHKGSNFPLKYALPGWTQCVDNHPNVLDSDFWTKEVQRWGSFHNHHFPNHPFDEYHGKDKGHACASHVEPRLMLWYACDRLCVLRGIDKPVRVLLGELFRLRDYDEKIEAEIFLTRAPCKKCLEIKKLIEDYTRIIFHIRVIPTLGELQLERSKHGWVTFSRYAQVNDDDRSEPDMEDAEFEEDGEEEVEVLERQKTVEKTKSTFAVVIRGNPNTPEKQAKSKQQQLTPPSTGSSTVTKTSTLTQKRRIHSFSYQPANALLVGSRSQDSDSDISDYQPPSSSQRKTESINAKTPNQDRYSSGSTSHNSSPFGAEASRQAKLLKKERERKRRAQGEVSPSLGKKARYSKF